MKDTNKTAFKLALDKLWKLAAQYQHPARDQSLGAEDAKRIAEELVMGAKTVAEMIPDRETLIGWNYTGVSKRDFEKWREKYDTLIQAAATLSDDRIIDRAAFLFHDLCLKLDWDRELATEQRSTDQTP